MPDGLREPCPVSFSGESSGEEEEEEEVSPLGGLWGDLSQEERRWTTSQRQGWALRGWEGGGGEPLARHLPLCGLPGDPERPCTAPCSFLQPGMRFSGTQQVGARSRSEAWRVHVRLQDVDLQRGLVCGSMEAVLACSVTAIASRVETWWEGQIIDGRAHSFQTKGWGATRGIDLRHWSLFSGFAELREHVTADGSCAVDLSALPCIFMRWKETRFLSADTLESHAGLSINGYYYVCLSRRDGAISGLYYDPCSRPFQQLKLQPLSADAYSCSAAGKGAGAMCFASCAFR